MNLDGEVVAWLAVVAAALSVILVVAVVVLALRLRVVRRTQVRAFAGVERDVVALIADHSDRLDGVDDRLEALSGRTEELRALLSRDLSRFAVVRYDAFEDMGGALSFSAALLDEHGDGLVISAINGRQETRSYAKSVQGGTSEHSLSAEEVRAIEAALEDRRGTQAPATRRRRRRAS